MKTFIPFFVLTAIWNLCFIYSIESILPTQMPTRTAPAPSRKFPLTKRQPAPAADSNALVPFSTRLPQPVVDDLTEAAGVGTAPAMARKVLTDWSVDYRATSKGRP